MSHLRYEKVEIFSHDELIRELQSSDPARISAALYSAARYDEEWKWVQDECLKFLHSPHVPVRLAAATCLADLAFFFKRPIEVHRVLAALMEATLDPALMDTANYSISLINQASRVT